MQSDPFIGRRLIDKYEVVRMLGRGGFGAVYEGIQYPVGRKVAIKVIAPEQVRDEEVRARFLAEAGAVAALSHPSIVTLFDSGVDPAGDVFMVLEYIDGQELGVLMRRSGPLPPTRVGRLGRQALSGLAEAHRAGLVHRDLKPANLMVVRDALGEEQLKILDFGIAKLLASEDGVRTRSGVALGTPTYMAPEQARAKGIGPWSDQYALGVVLYEMLSGRPPFEADSGFDMLLHHTRTPVPPLPSELKVPAAMEAIVRRALSKEPADRFPDVGAMARALAEAEGGRGSPRVAGGPERTRSTRPLSASDEEASLSVADGVEPVLQPTAAMRTPVGPAPAVDSASPAAVRSDGGRSRAVPPAPTVDPAPVDVAEPPKRSSLRWLLALGALGALVGWWASSSDSGSPGGSPAASRADARLAIARLDAGVPAPADTLPAAPQILAGPDAALTLDAHPPDAAPRDARPRDAAPAPATSRSVNRHSPHRAADAGSPLRPLFE